MIDENLCHLITLGLFIGTRMDHTAVEREDLSAGQSEQDWRVRGNDELSAALRTAVNFHEQRELPLGRQCCFGFIEKIDPVLTEGILNQCKKALPVRFLVVVLRNAAGPSAVLVLHGGNIVEALRAEKVSVDRSANAAGKADGTVQFRMGIVGREIVISCAALGVEAIGDRDRFQQCRFSAAVFTDKEGDRLLEINLLSAADRRDGAKVAVGRYFAPVNHGASYKLIGHGNPRLGAYVRRKTKQVVKQKALL